MKLSNRVTLDDLVYSETALKHGIDNTPKNLEVIENLKALCVNVLEPVFEHFGGQPDITSGYRCRELNRRLGSSDTSQHCIGEAVDFGIIDTDIRDIAHWVDQNLEYDHLIIEKFNPDDLNKGWIHVSFKRSGDNRKQFQEFDGDTYKDVKTRT